MTEIEKGKEIAPQDTYRIMIVDGKQSHTDRIKKACKAAGQEVVGVCSISEAEKFLATKDHVDVIISEAFLETDNVFDLIILVKRDSRHSDVPVLLIADEPGAVGNYCLDTVASAADTLGAHKLIHMPKFQIEQLMKEIKQLLSKSGLPKREKSVQVNKSDKPSI